jgi:hypothetical protein
MNITHYQIVEDFIVNRISFIYLDNRKYRLVTCQGGNREFETFLALSRGIKVDTNTDMSDLLKQLNTQSW